MATHDYIIANQSGAAFRTDLNNALAAIVSNNSNSSSPSTTYAYQWWADTSAGILKLRNSANNAWIDMLNLDGTFVFDLEDGSASAPSLRFADDVNTGIFSGGADEFNIATGGVERMAIDSSGRLLVNGTDASAVHTNADDVIIGNTSASLMGLSIVTSTSGYATLQFSDGGGNKNQGQIAYNHSTNAMQFTTNESLAMTIDSSGRLLIGTTTQFGDGNDKLLIEKGTDGGRIGFGTSATFSECIIGSIHAYWADNKKVAAINFFGGSDTTNRDDGSIRFATSESNNLAEKCRITNESTPTFLIQQTSANADANGWTLRGAIQSSSCCFTSTDVRTFFEFTSKHSTGSKQSKIAFMTDGKIFARNTTLQAYTSERRTKKNIIELDSEKAWNTLRDTPFYTFNFKDEIEGTELHHGPIVDECPEDLIVPTLKKDEVGIINTINTEKLQYRAYSALQQALKKIEVLETKVAALEAA